MTARFENINRLFDNIKRQSNNGTVICSYAFEYENIQFYPILNNLKNSSEIYFYSSTPSENKKFLGVDSVLSISQEGNNRVQATSSKIHDMDFRQVNNYQDMNLASVPLFLGGMKFSPDSEDTIWNDYSDSEWIIPKLLFYRTDGKDYVIYNFIIESGDVPDAAGHETLLEHCMKVSAETVSTKECTVVKTDRDDELQKVKWISQVQSALDQIRAGKYHKIVLSRLVSNELNCMPKFGNIVDVLESRYPKCYIFAFSKNNSTFFGASPEKLAKISDGWVEADALAGSIGRGESEEEDLRLEQELLNSTKNLNEQKAVVEFIVNSFSDFSEEIFYDKDPIIRKLPNIQHLWTPIKARLKGNKSILSILKDIHPTPAICGVPWNSALVSIKEMETHSRGLFAGMIGWFNFNNEGEFAVAIRSALAKEKNVYALAGCGIVEGSDPELEYNEAELKLRPILTLFKNEEIYQS